MGGVLSSVKENSMSYFSIMGIMFVMAFVRLGFIGPLNINLLVSLGIIYGYFCYKLYDKCKDVFKVSGYGILTVSIIAIVVKIVANLLPPTSGPLLVVKTIIKSPLYNLIVAHFLGMAFIATNLACPKKE